MGKYRSKYRGVLGVADFASADAVLVADTWSRMGEYVLPAGLEIAIGYGVHSGQEDADGRVYMDLNSGVATPIVGTVRLCVYSPQDRLLTILHEWHTSHLKTSTTDRRQQLSLPEGLDNISEDKKLVLECNNPAALFDVSESSIVLDITRYEVV